MIELVKQSWSEKAAAHLFEALGDCLPLVAGDVQTGRCELWRVVNYGYVVTRLERRAHGDVLVLVAGQRDSENGKFHYIEAVKAFCNLAANIGCIEVEAATHRPGIEKMIEQIGFKPVQRVFSLDIESAKNGQ